MGHGAWAIFAFIKLGIGKKEDFLSSSFANGLDITRS
jgi:hypothetical protein